MTASLSPVGGMSDLDQQSSPVRHGNGYGHEHSFVNHSEDEDTRMDDHPPRVGKPHRSCPSTGPHSFVNHTEEDEDTRMDDHPPRVGKPHRSRPSTGPKRGGSEPNKDASNIGKVKHLKKEDGEPLWRKDIQYDFLKAVFDNDLKVFTNSYEPNLPKQCFADLYIDTMSRSSKTSKVLRDKLLSDREAAKGMAMVCLLVNIGRMNTTLNFFPEMRAQLRTYHAIPSLQAYQDPHQYKQLQDAPRLKSILKGGTDDRPEPQSLDRIKARQVPRTNPVNLIFVICQAAPKVAELHFPAGREFHDLVMRPNFTSASRARAFLWIMWFYLESDFTEEGCEENPFGPGVDYGLDVANQGVPRLEEMTSEEEEQENIDPPAEIEFGLEKKAMRARIIEADQALIAESQNKRPGAAAVRNRTFLDDTPGPTSGILPRIRPSKNDSDLESFASTPPPRGLGAKGGPVSVSGTTRRGAGSLKYPVEASSPGVQIIEGLPARKPRPPTAHQLAVERNRNQRVEYILDKGIRRQHHKSRKERRHGSAMVRHLGRLTAMESPFDDSGGEEILSENQHTLRSMAGMDDPNLRRNYPFREPGMGAIAPLITEEDDFGEEAASYAAALRRANRRLTRWENHPDRVSLGVIRPIKRPRLSNGAGQSDEDDDDRMDTEMIDPAETEDEAEVLLRQAVTRRVPRPKTNGAAQGKKTNGHTAASSRMDMEEELDDVEKELLGEADIDGGDEAEERDAMARGDKDPDDEELDDLDKTLLGLGGESDSD